MLGKRAHEILPSEQLLVDLDSAIIAQPDESVDAVGREKVTFEHLDRDYGAPGNEERFTIKRDDEPANRAGLGLRGYEVTRFPDLGTPQPRNHLIGLALFT
jgi:hypothetical protein